MMTPLDRFAHVASRLFNAPLAVHPAKADMIVAALADRLGIIRINGAAPISLGQVPFAHVGDEDSADINSSYDVVDGIALVPIQGTLVHKLGSARPICGMMGYDGIRANLAQAVADPAVRAIVLDMDSPGGEVSGCFDLVDAIRALRGVKPIWAILSEVAYSAAYAIASACDHITVPRTGGAGSIGVVAMHVDFSQALAKDGIAVTFVQFGATKTDGNQYKPLSDPALARFQAEIDRLGTLFVDTVAENRGLSANAVRDQQAATFHGAAAVSAGLADAVMAPDEAFLALLASL
jgi:capsid assembly protease